MAEWHQNFLYRKSPEPFVYASGRIIKGVMLVFYFLCTQTRGRVNPSLYGREMNHLAKDFIDAVPLN